MGLIYNVNFYNQRGVWPGSAERSLQGGVWELGGLLLVQLCSGFLASLTAPIISPSSFDRVRPRQVWHGRQMVLLYAWHSPPHPPPHPTRLLREGWGCQNWVRKRVQSVITLQT